MDNSYVSTIGNTNFKYNVASVFVDALVNNYGAINNKNYLMLANDPYTIKLVWMKGSGLYDEYGNINNFTSNMPVSTIMSIMLDKPDIKKIFQDKIQNIPSHLEYFIMKWKNFNLSKTCKRYKDFVISNMKIPQDSNEYKDIEKMIDNLYEMIDKRAEYLIKNKNLILNKCKEMLSEQAGRDAILSSSSSKLEVLSYKKSSKSTKSNVNQDFELYKNVPISNETYGVHTLNKKDFDKLAKEMKVRAGYQIDNKSRKKSIKKSRS